MWLLVNEYAGYREPVVPRCEYALRATYRSNTWNVLHWRRNLGYRLHPVLFRVIVFRKFYFRNFVRSGYSRKVIRIRE